MPGRRWTRIEDNLLKDLAGKVPASKLALVFGRTQCAVHARIKRLKKNGIIRGEYHWNCKLPDVVACMIGSLHDAGYTPTDIHKLVTSKHEVTYNHVQDICQGRSRRVA